LHYLENGFNRNGITIMEYALFALGIFLMFSLIGVILYVSWIVRYGVEEYNVGGVSVRSKCKLKSYNTEVRMIVTACQRKNLLTRETEPAVEILSKVCVILCENLYGADGRKCTGLASRVNFMGLPGQKRYLIHVDIGYVRSKSLSYLQTETLLQHEMWHHYYEYTNGRPWSE